jgi:hypothetical protein
MQETAQDGANGPGMQTYMRDILNILSFLHARWDVWDIITLSSNQRCKQAECTLMGERTGDKGPSCGIGVSTREMILSA